MPGFVVGAAIGVLILCLRGYLVCVCACVPASACLCSCAST